MHHVTLHKSSDDVDVTYKADVKFNVMGARAKSARIGDAFRSAITSRTRYVSTAWCINIDHLISYSAKKTGPRTSGALRARVCRCAQTTETLDARYSSSGMRNCLASTSVARRTEERAIYVKSQSTASPEKRTLGELLNNHIMDTRLFVFWLYMKN